VSRNVTLGQLKADVRDQADVAGLEARHTASLLVRRINQSIQRFRERLSTEGCQHFLTSTTQTLSAGATSPYPFYALDLSGVSPSVVRTYAVDLTVNGEVKTLVHVPFEERARYGSAQSLSEPVAWSNYQTAKVAIMPAPGSSYTAVVWYLPVLPDLSSDSDTFDGVAGWEEYVVWDVVCQVTTRDQNAQAYAMVESTRDRVFRDILRSATNVSRAGGAVIGRDHLGERMGMGGLNGRRPPPWR
jgi:hypothetical protein